jgi:hypothetical protein
MAGKFKAVSIMNDDYDYFEKIRQKWVEKNIANIGMPQVLKVAMTDLEAKLDVK